MDIEPYSQISKKSQLYRYVVNDEQKFIVKYHKIKSLHCETYLSPDKYNSADEAQRFLSLPIKPEYRVGPICSLDVTFDGVFLRRVRAKYGHPGGGWELTTHQPIIYGNIESI